MVSGAYLLSINDSWQNRILRGIFLIATLLLPQRDSCHIEILRVSVFASNTGLDRLNDVIIILASRMDKLSTYDFSNFLCDI